MEVQALGLAAAARATSASLPRVRLADRLVLGFAGMTLPLVALTVLVASQSRGAPQLVALGLGSAALLVTGGVGLWLLHGLARPLMRASFAAARMSAGDLTRPVDAGRGGEVRELLKALEEVRGRLAGVVSEVRDATTHVAMNSSQVTRDNEALGQRGDIQSTSLQETAASLEQLTAAVRQNAETASEANGLVRAASECAQQGGRTMDEVVQTMGAIRASSHSIRDIIGVIDGIAFQTNILALNAAVEAARAGEQGRGFAVVAAEVRTLAQRCADAARQIRNLIGASVEKVDGGGRRVDEAGRAMAEIVGAVRQVAELIEHIHVATSEQSDGIESVNSAIARIDGVTQENARVVKGAAATAGALHARAVGLMKGVAVFDLGEREHGNAEEAMAMVRAACEFHRENGRAALLEEINKLERGRFIDRDLYLMAIDLETCRFIAHGNNPRTLGNGPGSRDVDGKRFVLEMRDVARAQGQGWVDYKWAHPVTNEVLTKTTYVQRAGDVVVGCGIYA